MSYNLNRLGNEIVARIGSDPHISLSDFAREFHVGRRTLAKAITVSTGKHFREIRRELLSTKAAMVLGGERAGSIKELSFLLGYKHPQSLARLVKNVSGLTPSQFRERQADERLK